MTDQGDLFDGHRPVGDDGAEQPGEQPAVVGDVQPGVVAQIGRGVAEVVGEPGAVAGSRLVVAVSAAAPGVLGLAEPVQEDGEPWSRGREGSGERRVVGWDVTPNRPDGHLDGQRASLFGQPVADGGVEHGQRQVATGSGAGQRGAPAPQRRGQRLTGDGAGGQLRGAHTGVHATGHGVVDQPDRRAGRLGEQERPRGDRLVHLLDIAGGAGERLRGEPGCGADLSGDDRINTHPHSIMVAGVARGTRRRRPSRQPSVIRPGSAGWLAECSAGLAALLLVTAPLCDVMQRVSPSVLPDGRLKGGRSDGSKKEAQVRCAVPNRLTGSQTRPPRRCAHGGRHGARERPAATARRDA